MDKKIKFIHLLAILAIIAGLFAPASVPAFAQSEDDSPRAYPALMKLAKERPNQMIRVIVQRKALANLPAKTLDSLGAKDKKELSLVKGFVVELPAKAVAKLAKHRGVRWISLDAPLISTSTSGSETVRDEFADISYKGNNGVRNWGSDWAEVGEGGNPAGGLLRVVNNANCAGGTGSCLRIDDELPPGTYIYRKADLRGAISATLSLFRNNRLHLNAGESEEVRLEISANGGESWETLRTYSSLEYTGIGTDTFDITGFASESTQIRMVIGNSQYGHRYIFFDEVEISYLRPSAYLATVGADRLHSELGLEGQGVTVAVVDSGVANHLDLQAPGEEGSRLIASTNLTDSADAEDWFGHGTHVAGIIGGNGSLSASNRRGVAPGVNLINIKVSGDQGAGYVSDLIEGLQWIYDNKDTYNIRVVNISINSTIQEPYHASPIDAAVEILWMNGIVVVVSSGNNGTGDGPVTLYPPANDPFVITVGATDDLSTPDLNDDAVPAFSAYGTTEDNFIKPELVAPGRNIISLLSSTGSTIYDAHPAHRVDDYHFRMSGTSMAAPMVSGAAALLLQDEPNLTPDQVKFRLMATANTVWAGFDPAKAGAGYLDAYAAVTGTTTESANVGIPVSQMLWTGGDPITWDSVSWNSVAWNSVAWNSVAWNSVAWNSVAWSSGLWDD